MLEKLNLFWSSVLLVLVDLAWRPTVAEVGRGEEGGEGERGGEEGKGWDWSPFTNVLLVQEHPSLAKRRQWPGRGFASLLDEILVLNPPIAETSWGVRKRAIKTWMMSERLQTMKDFSASYSCLINTLHVCINTEKHMNREFPYR